MTVSRRWLIVAAGMLICSGCAGKSVNLLKGSPSEGEQKLSAGIQSYEEANYKDSAKLLQEALKKGLSDRNDRVKAHKYLAFIHCVSGRKKLCTIEFKKIFILDPDFELQPAEEGHPLWGPVYRSVKGAKAPAPAKK